MHNYILLLKKKDNWRIFQKLFSHMIIIQYYNVLCAKFHLKLIYKRKHNTVCAEGSRCITKANKGTRYKANQIRWLGIFTQYNRTCFNYLCYINTRSSHFVHSQKGFTKHKFNFTKHSYNADGLFGANCSPNSILFNSVKVTLHIT